MTPRLVLVACLLLGGCATWVDGRVEDYLAHRETAKVAEVAGYFTEHGGSMVEFGPLFDADAPGDVRLRLAARAIREALTDTGDVAWTADLALRLAVMLAYSYR